MQYIPKNIFCKKKLLLQRGPQTYIEFENWYNTPLEGKEIIHRYLGTYSPHRPGRDEGTPQPLPLGVSEYPWTCTRIDNGWDVSTFDPTGRMVTL